MSAIEPVACGEELSEAAVRERFSQASRNGNYWWLWPQLGVERWNAALAAIETAIRAVLAGDAPPHLPADAEALGIAGYTSGMGPMLAFWLRQGLVTADDGTRSVLETHLEHNALRMAGLARRAEELSCGLEAKGVQATLLKGMHTAFSHFPEPAARPMSDIDVLVAPTDNRAAEEVLAGLGYLPGRAGQVPPSRPWRLQGTREHPRTLSFVHAKDPWSVDVQSSLNRRAGAHVIELDRCRRALTLEPSPRFAGLHVLPPAALVLHLACHAGCRLDSLTQLRLLEIILVVRQSREQCSNLWDDVMAIAGEAGAIPFTYPAFTLCEALAPGTVPAAVQRACSVALPSAVRHVIDGLSPASAQGNWRSSLSERFMWNRSPLWTLRQVCQELFAPGSFSLTELLAIYRYRARRIMRGNVTR